MEHDLQPSIPKSRPEAKEIHDVKGGQARESSISRKSFRSISNGAEFLEKTIIGVQ